MDVIDYAEEPGPGIAEIHQLPVGEQINDVELVDGQAQAVEEGWLEESVREHLKMVGSGLHLIFGEGETDFEMSTKDEERMAPPLTRMLNRYEPLRRAAEYSDPVLFGYGATMYMYRSMLQRRDAALEKREAAEEAEMMGQPVGPRPRPSARADTSPVDPEPDEQVQVPMPGVAMTAASLRAQAMQQAAALAKETS